MAMDKVSGTVAMSYNALCWSIACQEVLKSFINLLLDYPSQLLNCEMGLYLFISCFWNVSDFFCKDIKQQYF